MSDLEAEMHGRPGNLNATVWVSTTLLYHINGIIIHTMIHINKLKCCEFKGKQASRIESTSLCCRNYSVLHVRDQKNEWSVCVE